MAIYHLRVKVLGRGLGRDPKPGGATRRSAVAAAAYRSGERLFDALQGKWFQFDKPELVHTEILAPEGAPAWVFDRQQLWNQVERSEMNRDGTVRQDAQLAREVEISLPRELTKADQITLVRDFVREHFVAHGMVADVAIHCPNGSDGAPQPHAHILLTKRRLDASRDSGFAKTKEREWDEFEAIKQPWNEARKRVNDLSAPGLDPAALEAAREQLAYWEARRRINVWRAAWSEHANRALAAVGSEARIDHRTLEAQGLWKWAERTLGWARHIDLPRQVEKGYGFLKERLTHWVAMREKGRLMDEVAKRQAFDPVKAAKLALYISDKVEEIAERFRRPPPIPEVPVDR